MAFMAAAIPLVAGILGSMGKEEEKPQQPLPRPPSLGEIFSANDRNAFQGAGAGQQMPFVQSMMPTGNIGGGRGPNG